MRSLMTVLVALSLGACASRGPAPTLWSPPTDASRAEYAPYLVQGNSTLKGQAFLTQRGGGVVKAAGRRVTLDPATSVGQEWWRKAGRTYHLASRQPPGEEFTLARRTTTADADGRFRFEKLPPGKYFVRTEVTWEIPGPYGSTNRQGGALGKLVEVPSEGDSEVILSELIQ